MTAPVRLAGVGAAPPWVGWCCSYCSAPLLPQEHGLLCAGEGRFFATVDGVHRLLPEERRSEIRPFLELYQRVRRDEGWRLEPGLPDVSPTHPRALVWQQRARRFRDGLARAAAALGPGPWRVLEVGAGCAWASLRLLEMGHRVAAVDVNLDPDDGLVAANRMLAEPAALPRAEAEMSALPLEPGSFDLVLAAGALHYAASLTSTLVELRRVTRRDGVLLVLDSPVYRRRPDGEAMVAARMRDQARRYSLVLSREVQSSYFVVGELPALFRQAGWQLETALWPGPLRELARDLVEMARHGRRTARFPTLVARRDG
ncbi:MAG TPA: class I SAM-dependent methyltransferase [Vicinamibacteria bacterium]